MSEKIDNDTPYYVYEFETPEDGYYCHKCNEWHCREEKSYAPNPKKYAYNVCIEYVSLPHFRSCSKEFCQEMVDGFNYRHVRIRDLSISQGHKPVLI